MYLGQYKIGGSRRPARGQAPVTTRRAAAGTGAGGTQTRRITSKTIAKPRCPSGFNPTNYGQFGTGLQTTYYVDCVGGAAPAAPAPAPRPAPAPQITTTVSPVIQAQISPQISPTMAQQQASPGASVAAAPVSAPGPMRATGTAPTQDIERLLAAEKARLAAEAETQRVTREFETRSAISEAIARSEREAETRREAEAERRRLEAEAQAAEAAPPPPSFLPAAGPSMIMGPPAFEPPGAPPEPAPEVEGEFPWIWLVVGGGAVVLLATMGKKRRKRK